MNYFEVRQLGLMSYPDAMRLMDALHGQRARHEIPDTLLVLEHPQVISKGRRMQGEPIPNEKKILEHGIAIHQADRGGLLTYHGPGQLVFYLIFEVAKYFDGVSAMIAGVEKIMLDYLTELGVAACVKQDHPGIWVGAHKIASVGFRVSEGVTKHGVSLNVSNDLGVYHLFDPCGLTGATMTNLQNCLGRDFSAEAVKEMGHKMGQLFHKKFQEFYRLKQKVA